MTARVSRRDLLGVGGGFAVASAAGCLGTVPGTDPAGTTESCDVDGQSKAAAAGDDGHPRLSVRADSVPDHHEVEMGVAVTSPFSDESPARVRVDFTNTAGAERAFWSGAVFPLKPSRVEHEQEDARLQLVPLRYAKGSDMNRDGELTLVPEEPQNGCWQSEDEVLFPDSIELQRIGPCGTVSNTYHVLGDPDNADCLPRGTYRTEETWQTADDYGETSQDVSITWGLSLTIG